jgi:uncharacterized membrane protein
MAQEKGAPKLRLIAIGLFFIGLGSVFYSLHTSLLALLSGSLIPQKKTSVSQTNSPHHCKSVFPTKHSSSLEISSLELALLHFFLSDTLTCVSLVVNQ